MKLYNLKLLLIRVLGYEKPLRVAVLKFLTYKFRTFRPHYETMLFECCAEAKKLGYREISVLELGVAGGNGIIALDNYKRKLQKHFDLNIRIYGFDTGEGLLDVSDHRDLPFLWRKGFYSGEKEKLQQKTDSKIFYGDINDTLDEFSRERPINIMLIIFDMDLYSSTKSFLRQVSRIQEFLCPRVYCYFDDIFTVGRQIDDTNGELLAIKEFNRENVDIKIGFAFDSINDFKFPLARNSLFTMHHFHHHDYNKFIGVDDEDSLKLSG